MVRAYLCVCLVEEHSVDWIKFVKGGTVRSNICERNQRDQLIYWPSVLLFTRLVTTSLLISEEPIVSQGGGLNCIGEQHKFSHFSVFGFAGNGQRADHEGNHR